MSYARAHRLAEQLRRRARFQAAERRLPGLFDNVVLLYELGLRNGYPVNQITGAIVTSGYGLAKAAHKMGSSVYNTFISHSSAKYVHAL